MHTLCCLIQSEEKEALQSVDSVSLSLQFGQRTRPPSTVWVCSRFLVTGHCHFMLTFHQLVFSLID